MEYHLVRKIAQLAHRSSATGNTGGISVEFQVVHIIFQVVKAAVRISMITRLTTPMDRALVGVPFVPESDPV